MLPITGIPLVDSLLRKAPVSPSCGYLKHQTFFVYLDQSYTITLL